MELLGSGVYLKNQLLILVLLVFIALLYLIAGTNCWVNGFLTDTYSPLEFSYLQSPVFDFTNLTADPLLSFNLFTNTEEDWDGLAVQVSTLMNGEWVIFGNVRSSLY